MRQGSISLSRIRWAMVIAAVVAVALPLSVALAAGSHGRARPTLTLTQRNPATVTGHHFTPHAMVRVTLTAASSQSRKARPNAQGTFTVGFSIIVDRCSGFQVSATQPGHAPVVVRGPKPECAPAGAP